MVRERLNNLERGHELRLGQLLADPEWVTTRTTELRHAVEEWERVRKECETRLEDLREDCDEC